MLRVLFSGEVIDGKAADARGADDAGPSQHPSPGQQISMAGPLGEASLL